MIRIGVCSSINNISMVQKAGFDYLEGNLGAIYSMTDEEFEHACNIVDASTIKVEATNCMLLGQFRQCGNQGGNALSRGWRNTHADTGT